jgi:hypothetical protein
MTQRAASSACTPPVQTSIYDQMPLSLVLFRYLWPFWLFKNASSGDRYARAAAYRHNRSMRIYLPGYLMKWLCNCSVALALTSAFGSSAARAGTSGLMAFMAAGAGVVFACGLTVLFITGYIYLYLSRNAE